MVEQEKVYCLVRENPATGKYEVPDEVKQFLSSIPGSIAIISIAGAYRLGKSFFMNRIVLKQKSGFETDGSINACTKGIWLSGKVITKDDQGKPIMYAGKPIYVLVADTEGLSSLEAD
jgi:hypothetical protein